MTVREAGVVLERGRRLGWAEFGAPRGRPVFYFHGLPGSRLEARATAAAAAAVGLRVIAVERPGFGGSGFLADRRLADWPADVVRVADRLGLDRFGLLGVSGGGPYALACARALRERVSGLSVVGGLGPLEEGGCLAEMAWPNRTALAAARRHPLFARLVFALITAGGAGSPARALLGLAPTMAEPDRRILHEPQVRATLSATLREAFRQGSRGVAWDLAVAACPWGFCPGEVRVSTTFWHGEADRSVPPSMSRRLAAQVPGARAFIVPDEGHYSLPFRRMGPILAELATRCATGDRRK